MAGKYTPLLGGCKWGFWESWNSGVAAGARILGMSGGRPWVVLVEPQNPANIGFVARAVENFGAAGWVQIGGRDWRGTEGERTGAPAHRQLEALQHAASWDDGTAELTHLVAFTARSGKHREVHPLQNLGAIRDQWGPEARVGLVFGREDRGLETAEIDRCAACVSIPTSADLPNHGAAGLASLNLSHAVAVGLYEWNRGLELAVPPQSPAWASTEACRRVLGKFADELRAVDFPSANTELEDLLRRLERVAVETRDLRVLERMVRHIRHRRESAEA
jgi:tRNA/rRNA methyltransferase